jgi:AraC family transcriptional regulator of adaptative response/methylated-DNA-[protein]-cysteine methyltransferase
VVRREPERWAAVVVRTVAGMGADLTTADDRVAAAAAAMERAGGPVALAQLARAASCSARQVQRDFAHVLGVTPRQYGASVRTAGARQVLRSGASVGDALYQAGYGSVRGFYQEAGARLGMPPREYAAGGAGRVLLWSVAPSTVGDLVAVASPQGLCAVRIGAADALEREVRAEFPRAELRRDDAAMRDVMTALAALARGLPAPALPVAATGTAFAARVWGALRQIPAGSTRTYGEVAASIGAPSSVRAVARACATNPVALAVPCHRVVRADGSPAGYRWGLAVKVELLRAEASA